MATVGLGPLFGFAAGKGVEEDVGETSDDNPVGGLVASGAEDVNHGVHGQRQDATAADEGHKRPEARSV